MVGLDHSLPSHSAGQLDEIGQFMSASGVAKFLEQLQRHNVTKSDFPGAQMQPY